MDWVAEEFDLLDLGDERLNKRAKKLLDCFAQAPERSIPSTHNGWTETKAAYRFMSNKKVSVEKLLGIHREATLKRIGLTGSSTIILAQDTSELDYGDQKETEGRGPTNGEEHPGVHIHPLLALTTVKGSPNRGNRTNLQNVKLTAILATGTKTGKASDKLEWLLLTNGKLNDLKDVLNVIKYYLLRWKIEIYFKVLKSGCQVEKLQLEGLLDRLCNCLAL